MQKIAKETCRVVPLLAAAMGLLLMPLAAGADDLEDEHELSMEFVTPHTNWAKPYAGPKIRALFFYRLVTYYNSPGGAAAREIIELMQRFDLEGDAAYYGGKEWLGGEAGHERILRLLKGAFRPRKPYDVYVFSQVSPDLLTEEERDIVFEAVKEGAGILMIGASGGGILTQENRLEERPAFLSAGECYRVGKGRGVSLPVQEVGYRVGWEVELDYQMEKIGRALLWAAGCVPQMGLDVKVSSSQIERGTLPATAATVSWTKAMPATRLQVELRRWDGEKTALSSHQLQVELRRRGDGKKTGLGSPECSPPEGTARFHLPVLRAGDYHIDAIARSERGIESWATTAFTVTSPRTVKAVHLDRKWGEIGEILSGEVELAGEATAHETLRVCLMDRRGRILVRRDFDIRGETTPFSFQIEPWMPMLLRVEAVIMSGDEEVASAYEFFRVTKRHHGQFNFVMWDYPRGSFAPYGIENLAKLGTTAILTQRNPPLVLSAYEMAYVPYVTRLLWWLDEQGSFHFHDVKGACFNDEQKIQEIIDRDVEAYKDSRGHGVLAYSLGDEGTVWASCLSPHCLEAYQRYLEEQYQSISALNEEWETNFNSFADVRLSQAEQLPAPDAPAWFKDYYNERKKEERFASANEARMRNADINEEIPSLQAENYARWYDRHAFQCYNLVELCKRYAKAFKQIDPEAMTGFEGTGSIAIQRHPNTTQVGGDLDLIMRELDYWGPYNDGAVNELIRSIARPDFLRGNWMGYSKDPEDLLARYWSMITSGMNQVQWWMWSFVGGYHGFLAPHLGPYPATRELLKDTQVVRDGLGTLLMDCEIQDDGIAMLYSMPSTYIANFDGNCTYGDDQGPSTRYFFMWEQSAWFGKIQRAGLHFRYVTDRMLRLGEFDSSRYKVLILPFAFAIGDKEAEVIRDFVRTGGTVIADVRPGVYDGHCKRLEEGILDDVFGIKREGNKPAVTAHLEVEGELAGRQLAMRSWVPWKVDPAIKLTTARALGRAGEVPICTVNKFGEGQAVLLNFPVQDVSDASLHNELGDLLIKNLLAAAGVEPQIKLYKPLGDRATDVALKGVQWMLGHMADVEITRWQNGDIELVSLFGSYEGEVRVTLPEEKHVYDLRHHKALGQVKSFMTELVPNRASFYVLLPEEAPTVSLTLARDVVPRGTTVKATVAVPGASGKHAVRICVSTPGGRPAEWFNQVAIVGKEPVELQLPFAYNDPVGDWAIRAIDLYTDEAVAARLGLK